jgi:hypothetical protein
MIPNALRRWALEPSTARVTALYPRLRRADHLFSDVVCLLFECISRGIDRQLWLNPYWFVKEQSLYGVIPH